jgi:hypothetical protein
MPLPAAKKPRKPGRWKDKDVYIADDFDEPLPPEILKAFYGEDGENEE